MSLTPEEIRHINAMLDQMEESKFDRVTASFSSFIFWLRSINWGDVANKLSRAFELMERGIHIANDIADLFDRFF
jgi:hypothetical protein